MKVALVQRNSPLEIVTNMHSKRKTEHMVLFDSGTRLYGSDAYSLLARKPTFTPQSTNLLLGRDESHPVVQSMKERHNPLPPIYNATRSGVCLTVATISYTPEELVAMVLSHAKDITAAHGVTTQIRDCVLTVPSFYTQHERRALLDSATLANLNVLALIDETTAAGLHFGIDRVDEEPQNVLFYNMGAGAVQVSIIQYHSYEKKEGRSSSSGKKVGAFRVLGKGWDSTLGGQFFDSRLVDYMADEFNVIWNKKRNDGLDKDVRDFPRPMSKLKIQANKVKHVLSANNDMPVFIDSLYDDTNYQSHINRATFDEICHDLLLRSTEPIEMALKAANMTLEDIDAVELIGGGMRIPKVQEQIGNLLGADLELGLHINSDESMALGAAFHGANVSTAFRVRHVGMTDINPFPILVSLEEMAVEEKTGLFGFGGGKKNSGDEIGDEEEEVWSKRVTVFKVNGKVGVKKTIAFTQEKEISVAIDYEESENLPIGTPQEIERYNVTGISEFSKEMEEKGLGKPKVSLQFELSTSGLARLIKAEAAVEEITIVQEEQVVEIEEEDHDSTANEENELDDDDKQDEDKNKENESVEPEKDKNTMEPDETKEDESESKKDEETETETNEDDKEPEKKDEGTEPEPKKKTKTIVVDKEKKTVHKRTLLVVTYNIGRVKPYSPTILAESQEKLREMDRKDQERIQLEEVRNKFESFMYHIKNKLIDDEAEIAVVSTQEQRDALLKSAMDAEDWMYDEGYDATLATYEDKYIELSAPAEKVFLRMAEVTERPKAIEALREKLKKIESLMTKWETTMPQITTEERNDVLSKVEDVKKSIIEKEEKQASASPYEDPVFTSAEVPLMTKEIQGILSKLSKRPKPKVEKKNETETESNANSTEAEDKNDEGNATEAEDKNDEDNSTEDEDKNDEDNSAEDNKDGETKENQDEALDQQNEDVISKEDEEAEDEL